MARSDRTSDEDSSEESTSDGGGEGDSSSSSNEGGSDSEESSEDSGSGSSSGEDGSSSSDEESDEESEDDEETKLANKREDFEKLRELSAHMDNIVQRLANFFPLDESDKATAAPPVVPELPPVPQAIPSKDVRDRSVSARTLTVDRAVSARRLTTDRAVSAASGFHFDEEVSDSTYSNGKREKTAKGRRRRRAMDRERSQGGDERSAGSHNHDTEANVARESWAGNNTNDHANEGRQGKLDEVRRRSHVPLSTPDPCFGAGSHERLLWDELRESLAKSSENKGLSPSKCYSEGHFARRSRLPSPQANVLQCNRSLVVHVLPPDITMLSSLRISAKRAAAAAPAAAGKLRQGALGVAGIEHTACRAFATVPGPRLFDYETVTSVLKQSDAVEAIESAFGMLAKGKVDVPIPMHIGIDESENAGPGDCHIKGGYIFGTSTWTVKLANVSFYKNIEKGLPPGSGIFVVCDASNGAPLAIFQENRFLTDLRTGAAGAVSVKYFAARHHKKVAFIGAGVIAKAMARGSACVHEFDEAFAYGLDTASTQKFADELQAELGYKVNVCSTAEEAVRNSDVIFTQTPGSDTVLELDWLRPHATIIASGSDQPTKNEIPAEVQKASKMVCDLVRQCKQVGELRSAIKAGLMKESDVYAEIGEVVNGDKPGRVGEELIVVDLTGTGAQDAAIGQVAWDILSKK